MKDGFIVKNDCGNECPVRATADIIDHKWTTLIIRDLLPGKKRYSELQRSLVNKLTDIGKQLEGVIRAMYEFGMKYMVNRGS